MGNSKHNYVSEINILIDEIIKGINACETIVFCGAGISRDSGLPVVNQLVPYILNKLEMPFEDQLLIRDENGIPGMPFEVFMNSVIKSSNPDHIFAIYEQGEPNTNHIFLSHLIKLGKLKTIITTNYDKLIEKALAQGPHPFIQDKEYDLIYSEADFENINWPDNRIRIIKIHGSVDNKQAMAITINQVSSQLLTHPRAKVIEKVFSSGNHKNVLIMGYSSSDMFDLSPQIQAINGNYKKVYYIEHSQTIKTEGIEAKEKKNPYLKFTGSHRIFIKTNDLIETLWKSLIKEQFKHYISETHWTDNINQWYTRSIIQPSESIKYAIPGQILYDISLYQKAIDYYGQALKIARDIGDKSDEGKQLGGLGIVYISLGQYQKAIDYYGQALKIARDVGEKTSEGKWLGSLGSAYNSLGQYQKAIDYHEQALAIARDIGEKTSEGIWLGNLGNTYSSLGQYQKAIDYHEQAFTIARHIGNKRGEGTWLGNLGNAYNSLGQYPKAIDYYNEAVFVLSTSIGPNHPTTQLFKKNLENAKTKIH